MKCLIRNSDNIVIYAQDDLVLSESRLSSNSWVDNNFNSSNAIILDLEIPIDLIGGAYAYINDDFVVHDQSIIDQHLSSKTIKINVISMRQARLQLLAQNLLDDVDLAILAMPKTAQIEWEYATEVRRDNPLVSALQTALSMTDLEMDLFFELAAKI